LNAKFERFKKILNLNKEKILLIPISYGSSAISKENDIWKIEFNINHPEYELVHELGHIFLCFKTKYNYFAIPPDNIKKSRNQRFLLLFNYCNSLVDCFVDYNIAVYDKFYNLFLNYLTEILTGMMKIPPNAQTDRLMEGYLKFFPSLNYILRIKERERLKSKIENVLESVKYDILNKNSSYTEVIFKELNLELDKFNRIRRADDHKEILKFIENVAKKLPEFDTNFLYNNISQIFP